MAISRSFKDLWRGMKQIDEEPWFVVGGLMVLALLALLTVSAARFQPHEQDTDSVPGSETVAATSQR